MALISALALALGPGAWPLAEPFWAKDLGALARALAEARTAGETPRGAALFAEASALVRCQPLPPLPKAGADLELRALLRIEEARRVRLGAAAPASATLWRDALAPGFFRLEVREPSGRDELVWPAEVEGWPGEVLVVAPVASRCPAAAPARAAAASELPTPELLGALAALGLPDTVARLAYHRAVLLARAGDPGARTAALAVEPGRLAHPLRPFATLLRLEAGVDGPEGYLALVGVRELGEAALAVQVRAADHLARRGTPAEALAVAELGAAATCEGARAPLVRALRFHRAAALAAVGRGGEVVEALSEVFACRVPAPDPGRGALADLAVALVAPRSLDDELAQLLAAIAPPGAPGEVLWAYGRRALGAGNAAGADAAADALAATRRPEARLRASALRAEAAFARGDVAAFERHLGALLDAGGSATRRLERDRLAIDLASAAAVRVAAEPERARARSLEAALDRMSLVVALSRAGDLARIRDATRNAARAELAAPARRGGAVPLALGEVAVASRPEPPPVPEVRVDWPEPASLLALPLPDGEVRGWFDRERSGP